MFYARYTGLLFLILISFMMWGQTSLEEGRSLYENERFDEAIAFYSSKLQEGSISYEVHYNLGTAYLAKGQVGNGIFHLEKALMMSDNPEIREQLDLAQGLIDDDIPTFTDFFLVRWLRGLAQGPGSNFWAILSLAFFLGLLIFMYMRWIRQESYGRWTYIWTSFLGLALISLFISYQAKHLEETRISAIILESTPLHQGSDERSEVVRSVSEGIKVRAIDEIEDWRKVELPDKEVGWVKQDVLGVLK